MLRFPIMAKPPKSIKPKAGAALHDPSRLTAEEIRFTALNDLFGLANLLYGDRPKNDLTRSFHLPICRHINTTPFSRNLYLVPRGNFKTSLITITANAQRILRNPEIRILIASNKADAAEAMLAELKGILQHPALVAAFPDILFEDPARKSPMWTRGAIQVKRKRTPKESTVETIGVEGENTGRHYDHGAYDDVVGMQNSSTREMLMGTIEWARISVSLFDPGSTVDYIGTPWHYADFLAWLQEQKARGLMKLGVYKMPCWIPADETTPGAEYCEEFGWVRTTFPERFPLKDLLQIRRDKGASEFAAQYLLDPISADTAIFPREKMVGNIRSAKERPPLSDLWLAMTLDPASSQKKWADRTAIAVGGFDSRGALHILALKAGRPTETEILQSVYSLYDRFPGMTAIGIEQIGFAKMYQNLFQSEGEKRGYFLPIVALPRDTPKAKNMRIRALEPYWNGSQLFIYDDCEALDMFMDEATRFRMDRESTHDDLLDAVVDLLTIRARPARSEAQVETKEVERLSAGDPVQARRIRIERQIDRDRAGQKQAPLDRASMRVALCNTLREQAAAALRQAQVLGATKDEFFHV